MLCIMKTVKNYEKQNIMKKAKNFIIDYITQFDFYN